jgi:putative tricarboxylic transport membrane protein
MGGRGLLAPLFGGTLIGTFVGAIPGAGATPAALISYQQAKLWSKRPEEFGKGSISGIVANEAAQNASNSGELIPTLALGIPGSGSMVILLGALIAQGFVPGPFLIQRDPELLYAAIAGLIAGTVLLAIVGMRLAGWMLKAVRIDRSVMIITSLAIVVLGVFALRSSLTDVIVLIVFSMVGYFMYRYGFSPAAAALAVILSRGFEASMRHGLSLSYDSWLVMISRPTTAALLGAAALFLVGGFWKEYRSWQKRQTAPAATGDG